MNEEELTIQAGLVSLQGRRDDNQDFGGFTCPATRDLALLGVVAAVADGVGGTKGGRVAAEVCIRTFLDAFYGLPETLPVEQRAARGLAAANRWIHAQGCSDPALAGMATTFSALILRNRQAHVIHVGDSRVYRLRGNALERLTEDHTLQRPGMDHILRRAVGIEHSLCADFVTHTLEAHDRFLLCSDGLHTALRDEEIRAVLLERMSPERSAVVLAETALERGSHDNVTALVVDVLALPAPNRSVLRSTIGALPLLELPSPGDTVDGFHLQEVISRGRYSSLFLASDQQQQGRAVVLKFPHPRVATEREYHDAFLREAWIGARVRSPWVMEVIELPPGRQTRLYSVLPYYVGMTLERRIERGKPVTLEEGVRLALQLCRAVHALHRQHIIHRDIKPENILVLEEGGLKLLDLGVARLPAWEEDPQEPIPGTPSYMAPEQFRGERGSEGSDIFAVGVTLYRLFARGAYPYGEIEPFTHPRFRAQPKSLAVHRPDLPIWLDAVLVRALAVRPQDRYSDILELAYDLEHGLAKGGQVRSTKISLYERNPLGFWKGVALVLFIALVISVATGHSREAGRQGDASAAGVSRSTTRVLLSSCGVQAQGDEPGDGKQPADCPLHGRGGCVTSLPRANWDRISHPKPLFHWKGGSLGEGPEDEGWG
jgi:serine/threonine protein phosphatase PrpC